MHSVRWNQCKRWNGHLQYFPRRRPHLVSTFHNARFSFQNCTASVGVTIARLDHRLFANHAYTLHFLYLFIGVSDAPMATNKLCTQLTFVANGNGVSINEPALIGARLVG